MPETVEFNESFLVDHLAVDVRTPLEYEKDHIPGAINVPLLTNEERAEIGTLYRFVGPQGARMRGLELTAHRFSFLVKEISETAAGRPILVYCWRGGLRSKTVTSILQLTGLRAVQLKGGYQSYRRRVVAYFEEFSSPGPLVVLHGMTGVGKTTFLVGLKNRLYSVIDLEGLACHRGSVFGELGLSQVLTQKRFESLLWDALRLLPQGRPILVEGESKRIGRMSLPDNLYKEMQESVKVWCEADLSIRVLRLIEEYGRLDYQQGMAEALEKIRKRLGGKKFAEIARYLERWELEPFMRELMSSYYDRLYYKNREWVEDVVISMEDYAVAAKELDEFIIKRFGIV